MTNNLSNRPQNNPKNNPAYFEACKKNQKLRHELRRQQYYENPKICKQCNDPIVYEKRVNMFCSSSCSATYTNKKRGPHSEETKKKMSKEWRSGSGDQYEGVLYISASLL